MKIQSQALEVNLASYHVEVEIDPRYAPLQAVMSKYFGLMDGVNTFLKELSHPYKNWQFIVNEARVYTLDYFHLINRHDQGEAAARLYVEIFLEAIGTSRDREVKTDAVDNLLLFLHKIVTDAGAGIAKFLPVIADACRRLAALPQEDFALIAMSYYQLPKIARAFREAATALGGQAIAAGDAGFELRVLPQVAVQLILWEGDEEFGAEANILFNPGIQGRLSPEDIAWLAGMVVYRMMALSR
jgi:pyruvate,orthophosphate dikinase